MKNETILVVGGSGDFLSNYFLPYPTQLTGWYSREDDFLYEFWTSKEIRVEPLTDVPHQP